MRSTLAADSPYFRGLNGAFNVKHGLVDPSHTMVMPPSHKTRRIMDFMDYSRKKNEWTSRDRQHLTRETPNFNGTTYIRLPEQRDYFGEGDMNPLDTYLQTKDYNDKFFKLNTEQKINLNKFTGPTNYLTASNKAVGVTTFKQYYLD